MATTYEWDLNSVELVSTGAFNQVVHRCFWKCTATGDSGATKEQVGVVDLDISKLSPDTFIEWPIDKAQIVEWVKATVHKDSIEAGLHPDTTVHSFVQDDLPPIAPKPE